MYIYCTIYKFSSQNCLENDTCLYLPVFRINATKHTDTIDADISRKVRKTHKMIYYPVPEKNVSSFSEIFYVYIYCSINCCCHIIMFVIDCDSKEKKNDKKNE